MKPLIIILIFLITSFSFQSKTSDEIASVKIGTQIWTMRNLDASTFRNGDTIPEIESQKEFELAGHNSKPAWCYLAGDPSHFSKYGKLYNWYAVNDSRGLAPKGWHIPTDKEWTILIDYLGGDSIAGKKMKSAKEWDGDNSSGFNALPVNANFWSATEFSSGSAWARALFTGKVMSFHDINVETYGFSVRCVKD